jgi:hypothetical protein
MQHLGHSTLKTCLGPFERVFRDNLRRGKNRREALSAALEADPEGHADYLRRFNTRRPLDGKPCALPLSKIQATSGNTI